MKSGEGQDREDERVRESIQLLIDALPTDGAAVLLTRADLRSMIKVRPDTREVQRDLTVEDVGEVIGRARSTVRGWLASGQLRGYKLNGRDWRVTRAAIEEFLEAQRNPQKAAVPEKHVDITSWRRL